MPVPHELDYLKSAILPIIVMGKDGSFEPVGTGFIICTLGRQAVMITAAHNFRECIRLDVDDITRVRDWSNVRLKHTTILAIYNDPSGKHPMARVENIQFSPASDIAVCGLHFEDHVPENMTFRSKITLDTTPVEENIPVAAIGYFSMSREVQMKEEGAYITFQSKFDFRKGKIIRRYGSTGPGLHRWPCFQCNIAFDHGMSGGPVVYHRPDEPIVACGVVSSDFTFNDTISPENQYAMAGMLWPVMSLRLRNTMVDGLACEPTLLELQARGFIEDLGNASQHIRQTTIETDGESATLYHWV